MKHEVKRSMVGVVVVIGALALPAARAVSAGEMPKETRNILVPAPGKILVGALHAQELAKVAGKVPALWLCFVPWGPGAKADFPADFAKEALIAGAVPLITWEPWNWGDKKLYLLSDIAEGKHDEYLRKFLQAAAATDAPFFLRFAHEMEAKNYPWSVQSDPRQTPENYVKAFRHVAELCRKIAPKGILVWSPGTGLEKAEDCYPGDGWVDWIGCSLYNWAKWPKDPTHRDMLGAWMNKIVRAHKKPALICEMGCAEKFEPYADWDPNGDGDYADAKSWIQPQWADKARWTLRFFQVLERDYPEIRGFVWFHTKKEADWRVDSSPAALDAFKKCIAADTYVGACVQVPPAGKESSKP